MIKVKKDNIGGVMMDYSQWSKPEYYKNRELSWIGFNERVLSEAKDRNIPLFERLKFLSITASNLDEFFMIRVASLKDMVHAEYSKPDIAGLSPKEQLKELSPRTHELVQAQYNTYNRSLIPALSNIGVNVVSSHEQLSKGQAAYVDTYFEENVYPVLTPMAMDSSRPFPLVRNKTLNIGALIRKKKQRKIKKCWSLQRSRCLRCCRESSRFRTARTENAALFFWRK